MTTTNTATTTTNPLSAGDEIRVVKGCAARSIRKNARAVIRSIRHLGVEFSHQVAITFELTGASCGRVRTMYARHANRLADAIVGMNDGNPLHRIEVARVGGVS